MSHHLQRVLYRSFRIIVHADVCGRRPTARIHKRRPTRIHEQPPVTHACSHSPASVLELTSSLTTLLPPTKCSHFSKYSKKKDHLSPPDHNEKKQCFLKGNITDVWNLFEVCGTSCPRYSVAWSNTAEVRRASCPTPPKNIFFKKTEPPPNPNFNAVGRPSLHPLDAAHHRHMCFNFYRHLFLLRRRGRKLFRVHRAAWRSRRRLSSFTSAHLRGSPFFLPRSVLTRHFVTCISGGMPETRAPINTALLAAGERSRLLRANLRPHFSSAAHLRLARFSPSTTLMSQELLQILLPSSRRISRMLCRADQALHVKSRSCC